MPRNRRVGPDIEPESNATISGPGVCALRTTSTPIDWAIVLRATVSLGYSCAPVQRRQHEMPVVGGSSATTFIRTGSL